MCQHCSQYQVPAIDELIQSSPHPYEICSISSPILHVRKLRLRVVN